MIPQFLVAIIEQAVNQVFRLDTSLHHSLQPTKHKTLLIEVRDWQQAFSLTYTGTQLFIFSSDERQADCIISTDLATLQQLSLANKITQLIRENKLDLDGDLHLAQTYSGAFSKINIDWEEHLSDYLGDAASHKLFRLITQTQQQASTSLKKCQSTLTALMQDELKVAIHPIELSQFKEQNRALKAQCAQLELRIDHLLKQVKG